MRDLERVLRWTAFAFMTVVVTIATLFTAGYTMQDPGGWRGAGLVALWLVPAVVLAVAAWQRPETVVTVLAGVAIAIVALVMWAAAQGADWAALEDRVGPIRAIVTFAAAAPMTILGLRRPTAAGIMLIGVGGAPIVFTVAGMESTPLAIVGVPIAAAGVLFLLAGEIAGRRDERRPQDRPTRAMAA